MREHLIRDEIEECPYLPEQQARMPLYALTQRASGADADQRLAQGQRRAGEFVYSTRCPDCQACIPLRLDVNRFKPNRSQQRAQKKGDRELTMQIGELVADEQRVQLFNKHRGLRGLGRERDSIDLEDYRWGFVRSCFDSFEINFQLGGKLVAVAICDLGQSAFSAVYTFYDPELSGFSLGTYSIMKQVEFCKARDVRYLYLGFYIEACRAMAYKNQFRPYELKIEGQWREFGSEPH